MPSAHAQAYDDDEFDPDDLSAEERPILLADIDRSLGESAVLERTRGASPIRVWREELTLALESLAYARAVLAADVAILRHSLAGGADQQAIVDDLPSVMAAHSGGDEWSDSPEAHDPGRLELDLGVFVRSDRLVAGHEEMALVDLSSSEDVELLLGELEMELARADRAAARSRAPSPADQGGHRAPVPGGGGTHPGLAGLRAIGTEPRATVS